MLFVIFLTVVQFHIDEVKTTTEFPNDFLFGAATAAYQIEGGWNASGKGENIWDHMTHNYPNRVVDQSTGDIACDSYHLYQEDVNYLNYLGVQFYRFSISWSRILPTGFRNPINQDGVDYYRKLIQSMKGVKIVPMITLYHWDLPQPLSELGGWANVEMARIFEEYADVAFRLFGKDVPYWITFNEPSEICETGYGTGINAPNVNSSGIGDYMCGKTVLLAHARAYHLYNNKYKYKFGGKVGITIVTPWYEPKNNTPSDRAASERALRMEFGWWANPIFSKKGDYPQVMKDRINKFSKHENLTCSRLPALTKSEVKYIRGTFDFMGLNHYTTYMVSSNELPLNATRSRFKDVGVLKEQSAKWLPSGACWLKVVPWGFRKLLRWIQLEYNDPEIIITENGFADKGEYKDKDRIFYHTSYLKSMLEAMVKYHVKVRGYTIWSLMDNMEWTDGYTVRFGLYYVHFDNPDRTRRAKLSVEFYKNLISNKQIPALCFDDEEYSKQVLKVK